MDGPWIETYFSQRIPRFRGHPPLHRLLALCPGSGARSLRTLGRYQRYPWPFRSFWQGTNHERLQGSSQMFWSQPRRMHLEVTQVKMQTYLKYITCVDHIPALVICRYGWAMSCVCLRSDENARSAHPEISQLSAVLHFVYPRALAALLAKALALRK